MGAIILDVAGVSYLMAQDGSYSKQTTSSDGKIVYQSVPAPQGASIKTLPAERVLVTVWRHDLLPVLEHLLQAGR